MNSAASAKNWNNVFQSISTVSNVSFSLESVVKAFRRLMEKNQRGADSLPRQIQELVSSTDKSSSVCLTVLEKTGISVSACKFTSLFHQHNLFCFFELFVFAYLCIVNCVHAVNESALKGSASRWRSEPSNFIRMFVSSN